jgi:hypothetical protein
VRDDGDITDRAVHTLLSTRARSAHEACKKDAQGTRSLAPLPDFPGIVTH